MKIETNKEIESLHSVVAFGGGGGGGGGGQISANYGPPGSPTAMESAYRSMGELHPEGGSDCLKIAAVTGGATYVFTGLNPVAAGQASAVAMTVCVATDSNGHEPGSSGL